jgi:hypothetical protein
MQMLTKFACYGLFSVAAAIGQTPALGMPPGKKPYLHAALRQFQYVEVWPTLSWNRDAINVRMIVNNGVQAVPLAACVTLAFRDDRGREIALYKKDVFAPAPGIEGGRETFYDFDVPAPGVWAAAKEVKLSAVDVCADTGGKSARR